MVSLTAYMLPYHMLDMAFTSVPHSSRDVTIRLKPASTLELARFSWSSLFGA